MDASSLEELLAKYKDSNHRCIVIAKQDSKERGFKVRNLMRKEEFDIRTAELVMWLRSEVQARHREGTVDPRQSRQMSQQEALGFHERANDVRILIPQHRSKKTNRRNIVESGMSMFGIHPQFQFNILTEAFYSPTFLSGSSRKRPQWPGRRHRHPRRSSRCHSGHTSVRHRELAQRDPERTADRAKVSQSSARVTHGLSRGESHK